MMRDAQEKKNGWEQKYLGLAHAIFHKVISITSLSI